MSSIEAFRSHSHPFSESLTDTAFPFRSSTSSFASRTKDSPSVPR